MYCHCIVCGSTFDGAIIRSKYEIPCKCPDCGKRTAAKHTPAVRAATEEEIAEYKKEAKRQIDHMYELLHGGRTLGA